MTPGVPPKFAAMSDPKLVYKPEIKPGRLKLARAESVEVPVSVVVPPRSCSRPIEPRACPEETAEVQVLPSSAGEPRSLPKFEPPAFQMPLPVPDSPTEPTPRCGSSVTDPSPRRSKQAHFADWPEEVSTSVHMEEKMWLDLTNLEDAGADVSTATGMNVSAPPSTFTYCYSVSDSESDGKSEDGEHGGEQQDSSPIKTPSECWSPMSLEACSPISGRKCSAPDPASVPKPLGLAFSAAVAAAKQRGLQQGDTGSTGTIGVASMVPSPADICGPTSGTGSGVLQLEQYHAP